jgi:hypothetical protein
MTDLLLWACVPMIAIDILWGFFISLSTAERAA